MSLLMFLILGTEARQEVEKERWEMEMEGMTKNKQVSANMNRNACEWIGILASKFSAGDDLPKNFYQKAKLAQESDKKEIY